MPGKPPHLLVALTSHGFGHAAMTAPVVNELRRRLPGMRVSIQSALTVDWLASRYDGAFDLLAQETDFGLRMTSATEVAFEASAAEYIRLHDRLDSIVGEEAGRLQRLGVDVVLANIPYVSLLAAVRAGVPAVALSCLNWADIYRHYFGNRPEGPRIEAEMLAGYRSAEVFLQPAPSMPMERLANRIAIGPIARRGQPDRDGLRRLLGVGPTTKIGLITFGGVESRLPFANWPCLPGWRWVVTNDPGENPNLVPRDAVAMTFTDLLCSSDVVVTKPGYGTFAEAAVNGVPVLYLPRHDWPESPTTVGWLSEHGRCLAVTVDELFAADSLDLQLQKLFSWSPKPLVEPTGAGEGAEALLKVLGRAV